MSSSRGAALINGQPAALISLDDRGLTYGDGLFETVAIVDGVACLWQRHMDRLRHGCERLRIPMRDAGSLRREADAISSGVECGVLKIVVTRGIGGRGYRMPLQATPTWILRLFPWPDTDRYTDPQGLRVRLCETPISCNAALAGLKHLGRLDNVLARSEWSDAAIAEGLMRDIYGNIVEGTQSNIFLESGADLVTPSLAVGGVAGVVRAMIMDLAAALGRPVREREVSVNDVQTARALYLTNSIMGIRRVCAVGEQRFANAQPLHPVIAQALDQVFRA